MTIYDNFSPLPPDIDGWNGKSIVFKNLIEKLKPKTIIEVGSWKGQSAITMANAVKELQLDSKIYCVDTWLGALEFMTHNGDVHRDLMHKNGYPQVYYQFLSNVIHTENKNIIIPIPNTTRLGYEYLKHLNIKADLIYIDASHDKQSVLEDINMYMNLLTDNGIIFGDDYNAWKGVREAVDDYVKDNNFVLEIFENNFWIIEKSRKNVPLENIHILISSNVKYQEHTYDKIVPSLLESNISKENIHFVIGGFELSSPTAFIRDEHKLRMQQQNDLCPSFVLNHASNTWINSFELTALIAYLKNDLINPEYTYLLLHDTTIIDVEKFKNNITKIEEFENAIRLNRWTSMNIGFYKGNYLISKKEEILAYYNIDNSKEALNRIKDALVKNEDFLLKDCKWLNDDNRIERTPCDQDGNLREDGKYGLRTFENPGILKVQRNFDGYKEEYVLEY